MNEYVIWGIAPNATAETLLVSEKAGIKSMEHAKRAIKTLESHGCTACRVQVINLSKPLVWDARAMVNV